MPAVNRPMFQRQHNARGSKGNDLSRDIPNEYRRHVGAWLREHRLANDLRQEDLAVALGVVATAISQIENGRASIPPERYEALADFLGIPHAEFGKTMLRYTNPWAYAMIFGHTKEIRDEIENIPSRHGTVKGPRYDS